LWWAEQRNQQDALAEALFKAYFTDGLDVGQHDVLAEIASETGLPKTEAGAFLDSDAGTKEVAEGVAKGLSLGLEGVPFYVVNGVPAVTGAQDPQTFLEVFQNAVDPDIHRCGADSCET
jgi:predicted DsbA family dithiol-disulfide isomerase